MPLYPQFPLNAYGRSANAQMQPAGVAPMARFTSNNARPPNIQTQGVPTYPAPSFVPQQQALQRQTNYQPTFQPFSSMAAMNRTMPNPLSSQNAATVVKALSQGAADGSKQAQQGVN